MSFLITALKVFLAFVFAWGWINILCQERIRVWKESRGHYGKHYRYRKDIRDYGVALVTLSIVIGALIYTGYDHSLALRSFLTERRPFLKIKPLRIDGKGKLYVLNESEDGLKLTLGLRLENVGTVPAYAARLRGGVLIRENIKGIYTEDASNFVVFPNDGIDLHPHYTMRLTRAEFQLLAQSGFTVALKVEYNGVDIAQKYYTEYQFRYSGKEPKRHRLLKATADRSYD